MSRSHHNALRASKDPLAQMQKAVFRPVTVKSSASVQQTPWVTAYLDKINNEAARGDMEAIREQHVLMKHLDGRGMLDVSELQPRSSYVDKLEAAQEFELNVYLEFAAIATEIVRPQVRETFEEHFGPLKDFDDVIPSDYDGWLRARFVTRAEEWRRRMTPKDASVGFGRPPVSTQFKKNQSGNPTGRRKREDDPWIAFREGLSRSVTMTIAGVAQSKSTVYVACVQLCGKAINGEASARRLMRDLIVMLDKKGMLKPPEKRRRKRRKKLSEAQYLELLDLVGKRIRMEIPLAEESLIAAAESRYGALPIATQAATPQHLALSPGVGPQSPTE